MVFASCTAWSDVPYRTFHDVQGRTFDGRVTAYDATAQVVTIQRADGKTGKMPLGVFSAPDGLHIQDWAATDAIMNGLKISVQLNTIDISAKAAGFSDVTKTVFDSVYDLRFENSSGYVFGKIDVEYCIFYRQGERDGGTVTYDEGICYGKDSVSSIDAAAKAELKTKSVRLFTEGGHQTIFGQISVSDANVRGIWLRLKAVLPSGGDIVREYRTSNDGIWKWTPRSIGAGLNEGDSPYSFYYVHPD